MIFLNMTKKNYITPEMAVCQVELHAVLTTGSQFETGSTPSDNQEIVPTSKPYDGVFQSRRHDIWEDEEEY